MPPKQMPPKQMPPKQVPPKQVPPKQMPPVPKGRPEAAAVIWDWQATEPPPGSSTAGLRLRGTIQATVGAGAGVVFLSLDARILAAVALTIAAGLLASALISPGGLYSAIDRAFRALGHQVGRALSWLLLPAVFYLVFWPFGRLFRRGKRDTMKRSFDPEAESYWSPHRTVSPPESYRRQF